MSFDLAGPHATGAAKTLGPVLRAGITGRKNRIMTLSLNAAAQTEWFGGDLAGKRVNVMFGTGDDDGRVRLQLAAAGRCIVARGPRGSCMIRCAPWSGLPPGHHKMDVCVIFRVNKVEMNVTAELPGWAG